ncbi:hypothetical protein P170DRAFT_193173 [Aspergillus steynii IBT 23096]|uniref:Uncharacterized protein n=1 Tax=Aspergillus steynii IBT 23096 TaxID=1392250 RepID=A0A2I2G3K8_9EURO|nr:uncharacterized protein P170DRAFT_193173 [Aspergillus steynii IBT 23096]PLB47459.1 hypothetical protein P170DRAFT_193173 [Aspergillus steynii IBT 23096]
MVRCRNRSYGTCRGAKSMLLGSESLLRGEFDEALGWRNRAAALDGLKAEGDRGVDSRAQWYYDSWKIPLANKIAVGLRWWRAWFASWREGLQKSYGTCYTRLETSFSARPDSAMGPGNLRGKWMITRRSRIPQAKRSVANGVALSRTRGAGIRSQTTKCSLSDNNKQRVIFDRFNFCDCVLYSRQEAKATRRQHVCIPCLNGGRMKERERRGR